MVESQNILGDCLIGLHCRKNHIHTLLRVGGMLEVRVDPDLDPTSAISASFLLIPCSYSPVAHRLSLFMHPSCSLNLWTRNIGMSDVLIQAQVKDLGAKDNSDSIPVYGTREPNTISKLVFVATAL